MPTIHLTTFVAAPASRVFDLSRCIDLDKKSMRSSKKTPVAGITTGLLELNETVTWKAKHLFKTRFLKVRITAMDKPNFFCDEQASGDFKWLKHEHFFKHVSNGTIIIDLFHYEIPYGVAGRVFNKIYLTGYIRGLLEQRSILIKTYAESERWKSLLSKAVY